MNDWVCLEESVFSSIGKFEFDDKRELKVLDNLNGYQKMVIDGKVQIKILHFSIA